MAAISTLSSALSSNLNESRGSVTMVKLNAKDDSPLTSEFFAFQYFPATYSDSYEVNFSMKNVPGGSLPIYQWVNGGARLISFQAYFTSDMDIMGQGDDGKNEIWNSLRDAGAAQRNVDIRTVFQWLRTFRLPTYGGSSNVGAALTNAPNKALLTIPRSGIGEIGGSFGSYSPLPDSIVSILFGCDLNVLASFPSGLPRIATADLVFAQIPQYAGGVHFPSAADTGLFGGSNADSSMPYNVTPRRGKGDGPKFGDDIDGFDL